MEKKEAKITLGNGKEYTIIPFNVGDFIEIEKKFGSLEIDAGKMEPIIYWFWLAIKKRNKDLTLEKLYELIDAPFISSGGLEKIMKAMSDVNGWGDLKNVNTPKVEKE